MNLPDPIHDEITKLCEQGDSLSEADDFPGALRLYVQAWRLLPEPREDWDAATEILAAMGDVHFFQGDFQQVISAFSNAICCPNGIGNPFVHLRLGQAWFELGQMDRAADELTRAYMGAGREIFSDEDPKYMAYLETILQPTPGHDKL